MSLPTFYVDGTEYTFPCSIRRSLQKRESDNSGYLMDGHYNNDVLGTYATYNVSLAIPLGKENEYANLFDVLAAPTVEYTFTLPYNQDFITFVGRVNTISDSYYRKITNDRSQKVTIWRGISFDIISSDPILEADTT